MTDTPTAAATASGAGHGPTYDQLPRGDGPGVPEDQDAARCEIRGRGHALGTPMADSPQAETIRGPAHGLGPPRLTAAQARAQERLDAKNSHLRRSLDDHGDRVRRKRDMAQLVHSGPSPSERMAALRRRVAGRSNRLRAEEGEGTSVHGTNAMTRCHGLERERGEVVDAGIAVPATGDESSVDPTAGSNEDRKIHQLRVHEGRVRIHAAACQDRSRVAACTGEAADEGRMEEEDGHFATLQVRERQGIVAPPSGDVVAAASRVAWHSAALRERP